MHAVFWSCKTIVKNLQTRLWVTNTEIFVLSLTDSLPVLAALFAASIPRWPGHATFENDTLWEKSHMWNHFLASLFHNLKLAIKDTKINTYLLKDWCLAVPDLASFVFSQDPAGIFHLTQENANFFYLSNRWLCKNILKKQTRISISSAFNS